MGENEVEKTIDARKIHNGVKKSGSVDKLSFQWCGIGAKQTHIINCFTCAT